MHPPKYDLIYDWNPAGGAVFPSRSTVKLDDETLRDGLQSSSVKNPAVEASFGAAGRETVRA